MKKTSLADIAKALDVSKTLVSMVLNDQGDHHGINVDTQQRVYDKAKELNYKPNGMARSLRTGLTNTVGLIVADISNPFYAKIARSIEDIAYKTGHHLIIASSDENPVREVELIEMLKSRQVDGLIVATTLSEENQKPIEELKEAQVPFVLVDRYINGLVCDYVISNNEKGALDLTNHLIENGNQNIALLTISPNHLSSINDRIKGYKSALQKANIKNELIYNIPYESVDESIKKLLDDIVKNKKVDAIFTLNNRLASACFNYFKNNNIDVPKDVAFASYDDVEWFEYSTPTITGISQSVESIGENSVRVLLEKIKSKNKEVEKFEHLSVGTKLIVRESSVR